MSKIQNLKSGGKKWHSFFPDVDATGLNYQLATVKRVDLVEIRIRLQTIYPKLNRDPVNIRTKLKKNGKQVDHNLNLRL